MNRHALRHLAVTAALVAGAVLPGCATRQQPDPYENWNRRVFSFNETVDENVLQPVAKGYVYVTPEPVRTGVRNFFNNLRDVWSTVNLFLQGRFGEGATAIMRVSMNTTFGLAGLIDIATPMRLERPNEDLGQTLGVWGFGPGAYIVWPFLGSSTVRDSFDIPPSYMLSSSLLVDDEGTQFALAGLNIISLRADLLDAGNLVSDIALDKYAFIRDAYLQRRQNLIYDGEPPDSGNEDEEPFIDESKDPEPAPAATAPRPGASLTPGKSPDVVVITPLVPALAVAEPQAVPTARRLLSVVDPEWALFPPLTDATSNVNGSEMPREGRSDLALAR